MNLKKLTLKVRVNKRNGQLNINIPKKKFSIKELDKIQKTNSIKLLFEDND